MSPSRSRNQTELDEQDYGPSRTQQRREALAVLALATQLVELPPSRLAKLDLPEDVREEIANVRRISSHIARKRQLAFLAKKMRRHEDAVFDSVRAELGENRERQRQETAAMHRLEALRERLLEDDEAAAALIAEHPAIDRQHLRSLVRQARSERAANKPPRAFREIFQLLKDLQQDDAGGEDEGVDD
ncbi:ribosome biogenesis factor YjgA [Frateuria terrea]|uniref:Dual-action ribosomal maturation protein DarP n=1 Tax=Frateuria terrea TaxID=529704 RepID=A0A1H6RDQ6_9GAMM|nr:ribosome biogenesis factor YjgA [Frateuria terrea]SEI49930.1 ribosome-associated protein [Frateuria terrea]SFP15173.1 ribosome-associated protein [Frateuria terrea]